MSELEGREPYCCAGRECDRRSGSWDVEPDDSCRTHDLHVEIVASKHEIEELRAENERLRAVIIRAKDALLDGQSTQWVHDLLVAAILKKDAWGDTLGPNDFETGAEGEGK